MLGCHAGYEAVGKRKEMEHAPNIKFLFTVLGNAGLPHRGAGEYACSRTTEPNESLGFLSISILGSCIYMLSFFLCVSDKEEDAGS